MWTNYCPPCSYHIHSSINPPNPDPTFDIKLCNIVRQHLPALQDLTIPHRPHLKSQLDNRRHDFFPALIPKSPELIIRQLLRNLRGFKRLWGFRSVQEMRPASADTGLMHSVCGAHRFLGFFAPPGHPIWDEGHPGRQEPTRSVFQMQCFRMRKVSSLVCLCRAKRPGITRSWKIGGAGNKQSRTSSRTPRDPQLSEIPATPMTLKLAESRVQRSYLAAKLELPTSLSRHFCPSVPQCTWVFGNLPCQVGSKQVFIADRLRGDFRLAVLFHCCSVRLQTAGSIHWNDSESTLLFKASTPVHASGRSRWTI